MTKYVIARNRNGEKHVVGLSGTLKDARATVTDMRACGECVQIFRRADCGPDWIPSPDAKPLKS